MRIALHVDCPPWRPTGIGRYMLELTRALVPLAERMEAWSRPSWLRAARRTFSGMDVPVYPTLSWRGYRDALLPKLHTRLRDIALVHSPNGRLLPSSLGLPQTVMVHDLALFLYDDIKPPGETEAWRRRISRCAGEADAILVNSLATGRDLVDLFPETEGRVFHTPLGVDHIRNAGNRRSASPRHILAVGRVEPRKNYTGLLRGYRELVSNQGSTPPLVIAGGAGYRADRVLGLIDELDLANRVRMEGYVTDERLHRLYADAHCLVHPALHEGFGFTVPEALGFGVPVVCSGAGALGELFSDAAYIVDPGDPTSIACGIARALAEGLSADQAGAVEDLFSRLTWAGCAARSMEAFRCVLGARRPGRP
ncbi:MAG: glycosyltransferase family 1 protein [Candidatus Fermentibacteraceae bacterium]